MAALFENDQEQLAGKIKIAEKLMMSRERDAQSQELSSHERSALNRAFHALTALRSCQKL